MKALIAAAASLLIGMISTTALASDDPIDSRQKLMLSAGGAAGAAVTMIKGETPYSPAIANAVFATLNAVSHTYGDYFPEGSTNAESVASPKIWEDMAGFEEELAKFQEATVAGVAAKPQDIEAFKAAFGQIGQSCQSCHEGYRIEK